MFQVDKPSHPIEIFYSYSHKDGKLRDKLETHLSGMKREGIIAGWHDRKINAGKEWAGEIDKHINSAQIILWLVSPDFIASDYCYGKEMTQALERQILGEARIIPIIIRPCDWHSVLGPYEVLPIDGKPVTSRSWHNQDEAFLNIVKGIRSIIKEIGERKAKRSASQTTYELAKITENKHILVVEDVNLLSRGYRMIFEDKGFHVTCLLDGKEALDFTERIFVDLIVLDLLMLRIGGIEFIERLRQRGNNTPIVVLTSASLAVREKAIVVGANKALSKDTDFDDLLAVVNDLLFTEN